MAYVFLIGHRLIDHGLRFRSVTIACVLPNWPSWLTFSPPGEQSSPGTHLDYRFTKKAKGSDAVEDDLTGSSHGSNAVVILDIGQDERVRRLEARVDSLQSLSAVSHRKQGIKRSE